MNDLEEKYIEDEITKQEKNKETSIFVGITLEEMVKSAGWKIVLEMINKIKNVGRLKIAPAAVSEITLHEITYIAGQIEGIEKLSKSIEYKIKQKNMLIKEQQAEEKT